VYIFSLSISFFVDYKDSLKIKKMQNSATTLLESFRRKTFLKKTQQNPQTPPFSAIPDANIEL